ncbi:hypothetical protein WN51_06694 [Melipona quadrifasciata]|uniref:Uncharacterized protein n=1 Tax=Melipona quadrifasciata TaxID=166423 RepID=A0A0M9AA80_9HYME|nr:hypothetical protein WN51_06694 [Melipona quadrifasciata]
MNLELKGTGKLFCAIWHSRIIGQSIGKEAGKTRKMLETSVASKVAELLALILRSSDHEAHVARLTVNALPPSTVGLLAKLPNQVSRFHASVIIACWKVDGSVRFSLGEVKETRGEATVKNQGGRTRDSSMYLWRTPEPASFPSLTSRHRGNNSMSTGSFHCRLLPDIHSTPLLFDLMPDSTNARLNFPGQPSQGYIASVSIPNSDNDRPKYISGNTPNPDKSRRKYDAEGDEIWNGARDRDRTVGPMINGNIRRYNAPSHRKPHKTGEHLTSAILTRNLKQLQLPTITWIRTIPSAPVSQGITGNEVDVPDVERSWFNERNPGGCVPERWVAVIGLLAWDQYNEGRSGKKEKKKKKKKKKKKNKTTTSSTITKERKKRAKLTREDEPRAAFGYSQPHNNPLPEDESPCRPSLKIR